MNLALKGVGILKQFTQICFGASDWGDKELCEFIFCAMINFSER
jgi:hypothetical protein